MSEHEQDYRPDHQPETQWKASGEDKGVTYPRDLNERFPDGSTVRDSLTEKYGPEGQGWRFVMEDDSSVTEAVEAVRGTTADTLAESKQTGILPEQRPVDRSVQPGFTAMQRGRIEIPDPKSAQLNLATGFRDDSDGSLTSREAHAWLLDTSDKVVDSTTPDDTNEK